MSAGGVLSKIDPGQMSVMWKVLGMLVLLCLVVSVCFNVYLVFENSVLKLSLDKYVELRRDIIFYKNMQQLSQRLVSDMKAMAKDNQSMRDLYIKYKLPLRRFQIDTTTGATAVSGDKKVEVVPPMLKRSAPE